MKLEQPAQQLSPVSTTPIFGDPGPQCPECRSGSNNWAVSGSHTASGKPLLSNDMHLSLGAPDIWYEAGLHTTASPTDPAFDATGFTLPGAPFIIVGRNAHVAWGVTNLGGDVQDIHIEHLRGSGDSTEFQQPDGSWAPVAHHREVIHVRGSRDQVLDVQTVTTHIGATEIAAPLISPLYPNEHRALSLLWTPYDPHNLTSPFYGINSATSGAGLVAAFASFGGPSLNLVYADDAGHIGYHAVGRIPVRGPAERHIRSLQPTEYPPQHNTNPLPDETPDGESPDNGQNASPAVAQIHPGAPLMAQPHRVMSGLRRRQPQTSAHLTPLVISTGVHITSVISTEAKRSGETPAFRDARPIQALAEGALLRTAFVPHRRVRPRHSERPKPAPVKPTPIADDKPIPAIPVRDYTIGSPLPAVP